ncbi:MAG: beta-N-acetylhexosaminidase [Deltaproteobacteria bacterium]|nr:beta-N-acetylhexosaminidase [Deltaproteobacteria bacterium]
MPDRLNSGLEGERAWTGSGRVRRCRRAKRFKMSRSSRIDMIRLIVKDGRIRAMALGLAALLLLGSCLARHQDGRDAVEEMVRSMSVEEKVGQLFMIGIPGPDLDGRTVERILERHVGSFVLFTKNCPDPESVARLTAGLQETAALTRLKIPVLVAIDQEQGRVTRLTTGVTLFPANYGLGRTADTANACEAARVTGAELAALGLSLDLAPVADVNSNPDNPIIGVRSFGEDPDQVAEMTAAAVRGYALAGEGSCLKHFPGHGDVDMDSHLDLPVLHKTLAELEAVELVPFRSGIEAGAPAVMTAHILYPALDPDRPATASRAVLQDILRSMLGFRGVVISDALDMQALSKHFDLPSLTVEIVNAGCDLLLFSENLPCPFTFEELLEPVLEAARSGAISRARLDEAVTRVLRLKDRFVRPPLPPEELGRVLRTAEHLAREREITLEVLGVNTDAGLFPVPVRAEGAALVTDRTRFLDFVPWMPGPRALVRSAEDEPVFRQALEGAGEVWILAGSRPLVDMSAKVLAGRDLTVRFFSLNDPYLERELPFVRSSYLNLFGEWVALGPAGEFVAGPGGN